MDTRGPVTMIRIYADEHGETHLEDLDPMGEHVTGETGSIGVHDMPATSVWIRHNLARRKTSKPHPAPRRQLVMVMRGEMEITTSDGATRRVAAGNYFLAEDVTGKGHISVDVGIDPLVTVSVGIADDDWHWPRGITA